MGEQDRYLEAARRVMQRAERGEGKAVIDQPCSTCRYSRFALFGLDERRCTHPVVKLAASQGDDDYARDRLGECKAQRSRSSPYGEVVCGPDGTLWEA